MGAALGAAKSRDQVPEHNPNKILSVLLYMLGNSVKQRWLLWSLHKLHGAQHKDCIFCYLPALKCSDM